MMETKEKYTILQSFIRLLKLNFIKLLRSPGGAKKVSLGFALGFGLEMLVISTASLIYILFIPIVKLSRGSLPASIIGNIIGKLSLLPIVLLPLGKKIGKIIYPQKVKMGHPLQRFSLKDLLHGNIHELINLLYGEIHVLIGMSILGILFGFISYFIVHFFYEKEKARRLKKRQLNRSIRPEARFN